MKKQLLLLCMITLFSLVGLVIWQYISFNDGKMHIIFCDVGQGDAILIKTPNNTYILVDGGPDRSVVHCLSEHMPFWQRQIDLVLLTHPHADHFFGVFYILERYEVKAFATEDLVNKTQAYDELVLRLKKEKVRQQFVQAGDRWDIGSVQIHVAGPSDAYLKRTSPEGTIGESKEFASLILEIRHGAFSALLTGDSQVNGLEDAASEISGSLDVLMVPHHGSASGLDDTVLRKFKPSLAVVSVGAENRYNHPHPQILTLLQSQQIKTLRTDQKGSVVIVSDGQGWEVK